MSDIRPIPSAPGYFATSDGAILSSKRGLLCKLRQNGCGTYLSLSVYIDGKQYMRLVHRLVCEAFHGPQPDGQEVRHLDGSKRNNRPSNLAWGTRAKNMADKRAHGTAQIGERNPNSTLGDEAVLDIRRRVASRESSTTIAADHGTTPANVGTIARGETWAHLPSPDMSGRRTQSGESSSAAKLTSAQVLTIRAMAAAGVARSALAARFGVSMTAIGFIVTGKTWKALPMRPSGAMQ